MTATANGVWDDPRVKPRAKFAKFKEIGDTYTGVIGEITTKTFNEGKDDESTVPVIKLIDGPEITCSAGELHRAVYRLRPVVGDEITVTYVGDGDYNAKLFKVTLTRSDGSVEVIDEDGALRTLRGDDSANESDPWA